MNATGWLVTVVLDAAFAVLTAATLLRWSAPPTAAVPHRAIAVVVRRVAAVALATAVADLVLRSLAMADAPWSAAVEVVPTVLAHSRLGHAWLVGAACLAALWATAARWRGIATMSLVCWATERAAVSHAAADGVGWPLAVQALHLLAMGVWAGSVWIAAVRADGTAAVARAARSDGAAIERLSTRSAWALAVAVATGLVTALRPVANVDALWTGGNAYTGWLRVKLACVAGAAVLGAVNRWVTLPRLRTGWQVAGRHDAVWMRRFLTLLRVESVLLLAALAAAARLASTEPPDRTVPSARAEVRPATSPS